MFDPDSVKNSTNKTRFPEWLLSHQNTFWISGKAGCGKSTLMKYLYRHPTTKELLRRWAGDKRLVLAGFFIFERGSKLQKSREGMLRSILYQILSRDRNLISVAFDKYFGTTMDSANAGLMTYGALRKAFEAVLDHLEGCKVCLFIDGLDEYRVVDGLDKYKPKDFNLSFTSSNQQERLWGRSAWITDGHKEIIGLFQRLKNWRDFKLCLSSRELPLFEQAFWSIPKMRLHELTLEDIKRYCDGRLEDEAPCMPDRASLSKAIVSKSSGVFLWVRLVIDMLVEGNANGDTPAELWSTLTSLPDELGGRDGLYARMLFNIRPDHRGESSRMLALTLRAVNPLDPVMLSFGLEAATVPDVPRDPFSPKTVQELLSEVDRMKSRLRSRTAGLLEAEPKVQFMHLTAKEFVSRPDIQEMVTKWSTAALDEVDLNLALLSGCIRRLKCCAGSIPELEPPNAVQENIMDIWRTVHIPVEGFIYISDAMHYARRVDARLRSIHERRELYTALLDELDNTGQYLARMIEEQHVRRLGRPGREQDRWPELEPMETGPVPVRGNFAEYAIQAGLAAYLEVKLEHSTREQLLASATSLLGQATMAQSYGTTALEIRGLAQTRFGAIVPEPPCPPLTAALLNWNLATFTPAPVCECPIALTKCEHGVFRSHPSSTRNLMPSDHPFAAAIWIAPSSSPSVRHRSAFPPKSTTRRRQSMSAARAAKWHADRPGAVVNLFTSAPASRSSPTVPGRPSRHAMWSGVRP
ncbi:hypothetical protein GE09DRAFT_1017972 [Coniochaeta sp. 2T2.1]|nr:hypothetical protein GE09DRAFT_1017972 [Coniochaeta sp. 2T2.1]